MLFLLTEKLSLEMHKSLFIIIGIVPFHPQKNYDRRGRIQSQNFLLSFEFLETYA